jgi:DNA-directed RNA polymerase specialized sigma24 family protein
MTIMGTTNDDLGAAFTGLRHSLRGFLARRVNDPAVVDDLLQDVFLKAQKAMGDGRLPNNLPTWLSTAARTKVIDHYRAKRPAAEILDENTPDHGLDGGDWPPACAPWPRPCRQSIAILCWPRI